jgi:hypothetical protein
MRGLARGLSVGTITIIAQDRSLMNQSSQLFRKLAIVLACSGAVLLAPDKSFAKGANRCSWTGEDAGWNHYYNGRLADGETVRAALKFQGCTVAGTWFDSLWFKDFQIRGSISTAHGVTLRLTTRNGRVMATLHGQFAQHDVFGLLTGPMTTDLLLGHMSGGHGYNGQTIILRQSSAWNGTDSQMVATVGITDQKAFNRAALRFWKAVRDHNVAVVSQCIRFPLQADIVDPRIGEFRHVVVDDPLTLERDYDKIFNWYRRDQIVDHLPRHLIWTAVGHAVRLGGSAAVFDAEGKVTGLP